VLLQDELFTMAAAYLFNVVKNQKEEISTTLRSLLESA
jgi:hypothetical protein